jgi:hypothetical protein
MCDKNKEKPPQLERIEGFDPSNFLPGRRLDIAPRNRVRRGMGASPLLESEIREVQAIARSAAEAARILGVNYKTYRKYAELYGIFDDLKNPHGIGIRKGAATSSSSIPLEEILAGMHPEYSRHRLKRRLLLGGYIAEECNNCGFCERRITDHKVPLMLDFIDGDIKNHRYENLRMLCLNCYYLLVGDFFTARNKWTY